MASADLNQNKKRKPPTFPYHHPTQARKLRAQWIEREKIKSKWRAEKRRDPSLRRPQSDDDFGHCKREGGEEEEEWVGIQKFSPEPPRPVNRSVNSTQRQEQKALAREAYSPASLHHRKSRFNHRKHRNGGSERISGGQPNMKLRMNALLDRIKRNRR